MDKRIKELTRLAREIATDLYGDGAAEIMIRLLAGGVIRFPVRRESFEDRHKGLNEPELLMLALIPEAGSPGISAKEIMAKTDYTDVRSVRRVCRRLINKGAIVVGEKGYVKSK